MDKPKTTKFAMPELPEGWFWGDCEAMPVEGMYAGKVWNGNGQGLEAMGKTPIAAYMAALEKAKQYGI